MDGEARRFRIRARAENRGRSGTGMRYSPGLRDLATRYAREEHARGVPRAAAARALGIPDHTLSYWLESSPPARFRRVALPQSEVEPVPERSGALILTTRHGDRVDGLDLADLTALLRALR